MIYRDCFKFRVNLYRNTMMGVQLWQEENNRRREKTTRNSKRAIKEMPLRDGQFIVIVQPFDFLATEPYIFISNIKITQSLTL